MMGLFGRNYRKELLSISKSLAKNQSSIPDMYWNGLYEQYCQFENKGYKDYFSKGEQTLRDYAIHFTYNYTVDCLCSGRYHLYTGVLNPYGAELQRFYFVLKNLLLTEGNEFDTPEFLEQNEHQMYEQIREVG